MMRTWLFAIFLIGASIEALAQSSNLPPGPATANMTVQGNLVLSGSAPQVSNYGSSANLVTSGQFGTNTIGHPFVYRWTNSDTLSSSAVEWIFGATCNNNGTWAMGAKYCDMTNVLSRGGNLSHGNEAARASILSRNASDYGLGIPNALGSFDGVSVGGFKGLQPQMQLNGGAANLQYFTNAEIGGAIAGGASVARHVGTLILNYASHQNHGGIQDAALAFSNSLNAAVPYDTLIELSNDSVSSDQDTGGASTGPNSTVMLANPQRYPKYNGNGVVGRVFDMGALNINDLLINGPNFSVDGTGVETVAQIRSSGAIAAIIPAGGGGYSELPLCHIQAPTVGTQAACHVTTMAADTAIPALERVSYTVLPTVTTSQTTLVLSSAPADLVPGNPVSGAGIPVQCLLTSWTASTLTAIINCPMQPAPNGAAWNANQVIGVTVVSAGTICASGTYDLGLTAPGNGASAHVRFNCKSGAVTAAQVLWAGGMLTGTPAISMPNGGNTCVGSGLNSGNNGVGCAMDGLPGAPVFSLQMGAYLYYTAGGSGHAVGDLLPLGNGSTVAVTKVGASGNAIGLGLPTAGSWSTLPSSGGIPYPLIAPTGTSGIGNYAATTIQMGWRPLTVVVDTPGSGYYGGADIQFLSQYGGSHVIGMITLTGQSALTPSPNGWTLTGPAGQKSTTIQLSGVAAAGSAVRLTTDTTTANGVNSIPVPPGTSIAGTLLVLARNLAGTDSAYWRIDVLASNTGGTVTVTTPVSGAISPIAASSSMSSATLTVSADSGNGALNITMSAVSGIASGVNARFTELQE
jgi:hypothetical protein